MRIHPAEQGSDEWVEARKGIISGSRAKPLMTKGGKKSKGDGADTLIIKTAVEILYGATEDAVTTQFMDRGSMLEDEARNTLAWKLGVDIREVGFCLIDDGSVLDGRVGMSPDGLIGDDAGCEIKAPSEVYQTRYNLFPEQFEAQYRCQVQMGLLVSGRSEWHMVSFCPGKPLLHRVVWRDEEYLTLLREQLEWAVAEVDKAVARIRAMPEYGDLDEQTAADMAVFQ